MRAVMIVWRDSQGSMGWRPRETFQSFGLCTIVTVGWVVRENDKEIIVALDYDSANDAHNNYAAIDKASIEYRKNIPLPTRIKNEVQ